MSRRKAAMRPLLALLLLATFSPALDTSLHRPAGGPMIRRGEFRSAPERGASRGLAFAAAKGDPVMAFSLQSSAFPNGGDIPKQYTCEGQDTSPALSWDNPPPGTQSFALVADDPDAPSGTWVHWVAYNIPASVRALPEGVAKADEIAGGGRQGLNDFRKVGYGGPCPPPGKPHRYYFRLYALNASLDLKPRATRKEVEKEMQPHVLGRAEYMGRYRR